MYSYDVTRKLLACYSFVLVCTGILLVCTCTLLYVLVCCFSQDRLVRHMSGAAFGPGLRRTPYESAAAPTSHCATDTAEFNVLAAPNLTCRTKLIQTPHFRSMNGAVFGPGLRTKF